MTLHIKMFSHAFDNGFYCLFIIILVLGNFITNKI